VNRPAGIRSSRTGTAFVLAAVTILFLAALAPATPAAAQQRQKRAVPSELWKTYPLNPSEGKRASQTPEDKDEQATPPAQTGTGGTSKPDTKSSGENPAQAAPADADSDGPKVWLLVGVVAAALVLLVAARPAVRAGGSVALRLGRGAAGSVRAAGTAPRRIARGGRSSGRAARRVSGRFARSTASLLRATASAPGSLAREAGKPVRALGRAPGEVARRATSPLRGAVAARTGLRPGQQPHATLGRAHFGRVLFYLLALVAGAGLGILVTLLIQP
jgi:hypothetical protein